MNISENKLQATCVMWLWNAKPETRGLFFEVNNNPKNAIDGANRVAKGMVSGVSDMVFLWNSTAYFLEFKTATGLQSSEQLKWQAKVEAIGFRYYIIRSVDMFKSTIEWIMSGKT